LLATYFLKRFNQENDRSLQFSQPALETLQRCHFPGNVRELENCVYRTATMTKGEAITEMDMACRSDTCLSSILWNKRTDPAAVTAPAAAAAPAPGPMSPPAVATTAPPANDIGPVSSSYDPASERDRLVEAMEKCGWVQAKAARLLGLTSRQIGYALKKHNIALRKL
jgi:Nif-specific regulatory protein